MKRKIYRNLANLYSTLKHINNNKITQNNTILLFHSISKNNSSNIYDMHIDIFENLIKILKEKYEFTNFKNCFDLNNKLIVTFDDGYLNNFKLAIPILEKYEIPCHIFVTSDFIKNDNKIYLNKIELQEMSKLKNVTIGSHGKSHTKLANLSDIEIETEVGESKKFIEDIISNSIDSISYPHGSFNKKVIDIIKEKEYLNGATSIFGSISYKTNQYSLPRIDIWADDTADVVYQKINGAWNFLNYINLLKRFKL